MFFGKACYERGVASARLANKVQAHPSTRDLVLPECAECHPTVMGQNQDEEGTYLRPESSLAIGATRMEATMNGLIYLVGLVV